MVVAGDVRKRCVLVLSRLDTVMVIRVMQKNGTPVLVNGKELPLVGRISMDVLTIDLRSQPAAKIGDSVILWGRGLPIERIALCADTIPYELVCGIQPRLHRTVFDC